MMVVSFGLNITLYISEVFKCSCFVYLDWLCCSQSWASLDISREMQPNCWKSRLWRDAGATRRYILPTGRYILPVKHSGNWDRGTDAYSMWNTMFMKKQNKEPGYFDWNQHEPQRNPFQWEAENDNRIEAIRQIPVLQNMFSRRIVNIGKGLRKYSLLS